MGRTIIYELLAEEKNISLDNIEPDLIEIIKELLEHIEEGKVRSMLSALWEHYEDCADMMESLNETMDYEKNRIYVLGFLAAVFQIEKLKSDSDKNKEKWQRRDYCHKNLNEFISLLYHENQVSKKRVLEELNIKQSAMSNFYAKTKNLNLYQTRKYGNEVYYSITREGRDYYLFNIRNNPNKLITPQEETSHIIGLLDAIISEKRCSETRFHGASVVKMLEVQKQVQFVTPKIIENRIDILLKNDMDEFCKIRNMNIEDDNNHDAYIIKYK